MADAVPRNNLAARVALEEFLEDADNLIALLQRLRERNDVPEAAFGIVREARAQLSAIDPANRRNPDTAEAAEAAAAAAGGAAGGAEYYSPYGSMLTREQHELLLIDPRDMTEQQRRSAWSLRRSMGEPADEYY